MDAAAAPQVMESAPHRLAVGVRNDGLGWVEIRTHAAAGQIAAVLATSSGDAQAAVHASLPQVREFLAGQQVRVDQLGSESYAASGGEGHESAGGNNTQSGGAPGAPASNAGTAEIFAEDDADEVLSYISVRV